MNLDKAKEKILEKKGVKHHFIYKGTRNQIEEFEGVITKCYSKVFIIETIKGEIKSFSYNDFIINHLKILS